MKLAWIIWSLCAVAMYAAVLLVPTSWLIG